MTRNSHPQKPEPHSFLPFRRWELGLLLLILVGGAAVRMAYLTELAQEPQFLTPGPDQVDMAYFDDLARRLAQRVRDVAGLSDPGAPALNAPWKQKTTEALVRPPGYPLFVAAVYLVTGNSPVGLRAVQMCVGMGSVLLGWWLARRLLGRAAGLLMAVFMAGYWTLIVYEGELHAPVLAVFLSLGTLHALLGWRRVPGAVRAFVAGFAMGLQAITAPVVLLFIPAAACWTAITAPHRGRAALWVLAKSWAAAGIGLVILILPFTLYNYAADGSLLLVSAGSGTILLHGNHEGADGTYQTPRAGMPFEVSEDHEANMRALEKYLGRKPSWSEMSHMASAKAVEYILGHPRRFVELTLKRSLLFWGPREISFNVMEYCTRCSSPVLRRLPGSFSALFATAVAGIAFYFAALTARRQAGKGTDTWGGDLPGVGLVFLMLLLGYAPYTLLYASAHYRVPLLACVCFFAAYGLVCAFRALRTRHATRLAVCLLPGVAVYAASMAVPVSYEKDVERWYYYRITPRAERGDLDGALRASDRVVQSGINSTSAWQHHGDLLRRAGRTGEALKAYEAGLRTAATKDDTAAVWGRIGSARAEMGDKAAAETAFREALELDANDFESLAGLARLMLDRGMAGEAVLLLERAAAVRPEKSNTFFLLGLARRQMGQEEAAEASFRKGMAADPKDVWPVVGLANLFEAQGRMAEAHAAYAQALTIESANVQAQEGAARTVAQEKSGAA